MKLQKSFTILLLLKVVPLSLASTGVATHSATRQSSSDDESYYRPTPQQESSWAAPADIDHHHVPAEAASMDTNNVYTGMYTTPRDQHDTLASSPALLEAFEKEITFMVRDFGQDLRDLVTQMKQSVEHEQSGSSSSSSSSGGIRTSRRRRSRSKMNEGKNNDVDVAAKMPLSSMEQGNHGQSSSFKDVVNGSLLDSAGGATDSKASDTLGLKDADEHWQRMPLSSDDSLNKSEQIPAHEEPSPEQQDWNIIDLDAPDTAEANFAIEDDDEELRDPLRKNLVKKAINIPFSRGGHAPATTTIVAPPREKQQQQASRSRNRFAKLFQGRRVESVVSLWTVDQDNNGDKIAEDGAN